MAQQDLGAPASNINDQITRANTLGLMCQCKNGEWVRTPGASPIQTTMTLNLMYGTLIVPARDCTVDQLAVNVIATGVTSVIRAGLYSVTFDTNNAMSASLLSDGGTQASTSTGVKTYTLGTAQALKYGKMYMVVAVTQSGSGNPAIHFVHPPNGGMSFSTSAIALGTTGLAGWQVASVSGALPSTPTFVTAASSLPVLGFHCSA
ncbi:hypothetical protein ACFVUS_12445 [Nocardia sp. NPDC058058]|uniref:hypothetical protein n=1 Tax=Nocardia sp. NPDC058058 TaxID=3346317 RepID=UPI0036D769F8